MKLSKSINVIQFDKGYWYTHQVKAFAKEIGITNSSKLRKDELEQLIRHFIRTGRVKASTRRNIVKKGRKDLEIGLKPSLRIVHYTSNKETKRFIITEALMRSPSLKPRSGAWYRLNRWRDDQVTKGRAITYGNLVTEFIRLNQPKIKFKKVRVGRYINFLAEFLSKEKGATHAKAIKEWKKLKKLPTEKDYNSWKKYPK